MRALRIIGWVSLAVFVVGLVVWFARPKPSPLPVVVLLPDGTKVTLAKVTRGPKHVYQYGFGWQEFIYPYLPKALKAKLRPSLVEFTTTPDKVMFWFDQDKMYMPMGMGSFCFSVVDDNGLESHLYTFPTTQRMLTPPIPVPISPPKSGTGISAAAISRPQIVGFAVDTIPRRQKEIRLRVYQTQLMQKYNLAGEIVIPNPGRTKAASEWTPETLPATQKTNGLEITLTKLETGLAASDDRFRGINRMAPDARGYSRATFQIKENGEPARNWYVSRLRARNGSGEARLNNMMVPDRVFGLSPFGSTIPQRPSRTSYSSMPTNQFSFVQRAREAMESRYVQYSFADPLWPEEPAWKIEVDLMRLGGFASNELWTIKGVRAPQTNELVESSETITRDGLKLEFAGITGPGLEQSPVPTLPTPTAPSPFSRMSFQTKPTASAQLRLPRALNDWEISLAEVKDEKGRKATPRGNSFSSGSGAGQRLGITLTNDQLLRGFGFEIPDNAEKLDITLSLRRKGVSATNELWTIKGVRVPKDDEMVKSSETITRDGLYLEFLGVSGPGIDKSPFSSQMFSNAAQLQMSQMQNARIAPTASAQLRLPRDMSDWHISLVEVKDEAGRKAQSHGSSSFSSGSSASSRFGISLNTNQVLQGFGFEVPEGAETLDITLAVTRIQHVQFTAKPTVVTNESQTIK